ncbi:hypothetical protein VNO80_04197 [Phaseolus coccineus]|uniref:Uncharacterized protein n=1 Tax=Phaseolus coccineus TaxID=3886 RepID=A0AAN9NT01_PHACN
MVGISHDSSLKASSISIISDGWEHSGSGDAGISTIGWGKSCTAIFNIVCFLQSRGQRYFCTDSNTGYLYRTMMSDASLQ